jgi:hypothetical protein
MYPMLHSPAIWRGYWWLAAFGASLPYAATVLGWWIVKSLINGGRTDAWWDAAQTWINVTLGIAFAVCFACSWPLIRLAKTRGWLILLAIFLVPYLFVLFAVNLYAYFEVGGPFP